MSHDDATGPRDTTGEEQRLLFERSPLPTWVSDAQTLDFLAVNDAAVRQYGYTREEFLAMAVSDIWPSQDVAEFRARLERQPPDVPGACTWRHRREDGSVFEAETTDESTVFAGRQARITIVRDVTEQRRAERALRDSEARFRAVFEGTHVPMCIVDMEGRYLEANDAYEELVGYTEEELRGRHFAELTHEDDRAENMRRFTEESGVPGRGYRLQKRYVRKDGSVVWVDLSSSLVLGEGKPMFSVAVAVDITEHKLLEGQLSHSQKMEAVGRLAGGVAHDFNNLLTAINGYCEMMLGRADLDEALRADIDQVAKAGKRASALTQQLLAFSRRQVLRPTVLDVNDVVADLESLLRRTLGEEVELATDFEPDLARINADRGQLEQVILNLVVNARDAVSGRGRIRLETRNVLRAAAGNVPEPWVALSIADDGAGMDAETRARIFEPFFTTKEAGTGLGLATAHGIVIQTGGEIEVESEPDRGTRFTIYLPAATAGLAAEAEALERALPLRGGTERVLLVEDEDSVRGLVRRILERYGYEVVEARSGEQALALARQTDIQLLLSDVIMPGMRGTELARRLRAERPGLRVLLTSGYLDGDAIESAAAAGLPLIVKPFAPDELVRGVRAVLDGEAVDPP